MLELLGQACGLEEDRGDTLLICFLPARRDVLVLRGVALAFAVLALASMVAFFRRRRRAPVADVPSGTAVEGGPPDEAGADSEATDDADSLRQQVGACLREHPGHGVALLRHWLAQEDGVPEGTAGGQGSCN